MSRAPHQVILASAGTGKTFRLARRFVQLLAEGNDHGAILATTFTRKAAREILARVMQWLAQGAAGGAEFEKLTANVYPADEFPGGPPVEWSPERCRARLRTVGDGMHRLQVRTLDSWFSSLARLFGLDLGLPPGWTLSDERADQRLRDRALAELFAEQGERQVSELLGALQSGAFTRAVHSGQAELLRTGLELLRDSDPAAWERLDPGPPPTEEDLDAAIGAMDLMPLATTKSGGPRRNWVKNRDKAAAALLARDWSGFLALTLVARVVEAEADGGAPEFDGAEYSDEQLEAVRLGVRVARWHVLDDLRRWTAAARTLLADFDARYGASKRAGGRYLFEDMPLLLHRAAAGTLDEASVSFRSGGPLRHLLLDEFQDTSVWQWRVLEPLLARVTAADAPAAAGAAADGDADGGSAPSLFCVGDVKQSIYGWRQGEPRLLAGMSAWYDLGAPETMAKSYRSAQQVLDVVNKVFGKIAEPSAPGVDPAAAERWSAGWEEHRSAVAQLRGGAGAEMVWKDEDGKAPMVEAAARRVAEIHSQHPDSSIGVLVRTRKRIPRILHELEKLNIRASGEGGSELTDAQSVQAALSLFRLADAPQNTMAAFHVASGPFGARLGLDAAADEEEFRAAAARASARLRRELLDRGPGGLLDRWRELVDAHWADQPWERRRYGQLVDLAHGFADGRLLRPIDFVAHVESKPLENPAPSRVRVMTIHASKGLEFDAVVLPLWQDTKGNQGRLFSAARPDDDPRAGYDRVLRRPKQDQLALDPLLEELHAATVSREQFESYCVLYVAMTRARLRLDMLLEEGPKKPESFSLPLLVERTLGVGEDGYAVVADGLHEAREEEAERRAEAEAAAADADPDDLSGITLVPKFAPPTGRRGRTRWSPSGSAAETVVAGARLFSRGGQAARTRGTVMHRLFEEIEWLDEFDVPDVALSAMLVAEGIGDGGSYVAALESFREALHRREVKELLNRHAYREEGTLAVWRERAFAVRLPEPGGEADAILHGEFDRVVLDRAADGTVLRAHIVDYKTGAVADDEELARKAEAYRPQMEAYRDALCALTGADPAVVRLSLLFVDAGRVAELG